MPLSNITDIPLIAEGSAATPGLWNNIFGVIDRNLDQINNDASGITAVGSVNTFSPASGQTLSIFSSLNVSVQVSAGTLIGLLSSNTLRAESGGTVNVISSLSGKFFDTGGQVFNVMAFGAKGDGVTNDFAAINATIQAAGRGVVYFPSPTSDYYTLSRIIPHRGQILRGSSSNSVYIRSGSTNTDIIAIKEQNIELEHLRLVGALFGSSGSQRAIVVDDEAGVTTIFNTRIRDVQVESCSSDGIYCRKPELLTMEHVLVSNCSGRGLYIDGGGLSLGINTTIRNSRFKDNLGKAQIQIADQNDTTLIGVQGLVQGLAAGSWTSYILVVDSCFGFTDINGDYEGGVSGAGGVDVDTQGTFINTLIGSTKTGFLTSTQEGGVIIAPRFLSSVSRAFEINSASSIVVIAPLDRVAGASTIINANARGAWISQRDRNVSPAYAMLSERSLGFWQSGVSTMALSYGTFNLNQARLVSIRTADPANAISNAAANEIYVGVGVSNATLWFKSGNTVFQWATSSTTTL
jgi:hypothetical protein